MPSARVLRKGRITIPKEVRHILNISEGDLIDLEISGSTVILRPKILVGKAEEKGLLANVRRMQDKIGNVYSEVMEKSFDEAIQEVRKQKGKNE